MLVLLHASGVTVGKLLVSESVSSSELLEVCVGVMVFPYRAVNRSKELRKGKRPGLCWTCLTFFVHFLNVLYIKKGDDTICYS